MKEKDGNNAKEERVQKVCNRERDKDRKKGKIGRNRKKQGKRHRREEKEK